MTGDTGERTQRVLWKGGYSWQLPPGDGGSETILQRSHLLHSRGKKTKAAPCASCSLKEMRNSQCNEPHRVRAVP